MKRIEKTKFSCVRDGLTIRGLEFRSHGEDNLPIAIVSHGFMATSGTVKHYARFLAQLGYAAFCFDFNGGCVAMGKSDGKTTDMSVLTEVKDLYTVIEYACKLSYTNSQEVLLMGCSQGGLVSALTASKLKDKINKLVLFYPAFCIPDDARSGKMMWARFNPDSIPETIRCGPMKLGRCYVEDVIAMNPFEEIKGYMGDVLIVHGTADKIVHIRYANQAAETYKAAVPERRTDYYTIENAAHFFSKKHDRIAMDYLKYFIVQD